MKVKVLCINATIPLDPLILVPFFGYFHNCFVVVEAVYAPGGDLACRAPLKEGHRSQD